jgi:hypothetical protein
MQKAQDAMARKLALVGHGIWGDGTPFDWRSATMA